MLAHNKTQASSSDQPLQYHEHSRNQQQEQQQGRQQQQHQYQQHQQQLEYARGCFSQQGQHQHQYKQSEHGHRYLEDRDVHLPRPRHRSSMSSIQSTTVLPTIADMILPSPMFGRSSSSSLPSTISSSSISSSSSTHYLPSTSRGPLSPDTSPFPFLPPRTGSMYSERDMGAQYHPWKRASLPWIPPSRRETAMEVERQENAMEELPPSSMMDQCEPRRSWSTSSEPQLASSPSPLLSTCDAYYQDPPEQTLPKRGFHPPQWRHSLDEHQLGQQYQHSRRRSGATRDSPPAVKEGPILRSKGTARSYPPWKARMRPFPAPHGLMAEVSHHSPPKMNITTTASCAPETSSLQRRLSSPRPLTPSPPLRSQQYYNGNDPDEPSSQEPQFDQQCFRSGVLPLPKNHEQISAAQRMLYERHPPSPKNDRASISSSSPTAASERSSAPTSPDDHPTPWSYSKLSSLHSLNSHEEPRHPSSVYPKSSLIYDNDIDNRLPKMRDTQQPLHCPELPSLAAMSLSRRQSHTDTMEQQHPCSSARSSISSASSSSTVTLSHISPNIPNAPNIATATTAGNSKPTNDHYSGPQLQRTEGMTVLRSEEGTIWVYNPITATVTYRCELCPNESFGRIHDLKRHEASKHQEMTWPCEFCHRPFVRRDALLRHYTVKSIRADGLHPAAHEVDRLLAARARAKLY